MNNEIEDKVKPDTSHLDPIGGFDPEVWEVVDEIDSITNVCLGAMEEDGGITVIAKFQDLTIKDGVIKFEKGFMKADDMAAYSEGQIVILEVGFTVMGKITTISTNPLPDDQGHIVYELILDAPQAFSAKANSNFVASES